MKQVILYFFLLLTSFSAFSQEGDLARACVVESNDFVALNESIQVEFVRGVACCYTDSIMPNGKLYKLPECPDFVWGECQKESNCYVSKNAYWLIDNTGTSFAENTIYEIKWDDGTVSVTSQLPTTSWTNQLLYWAAVTFNDGTDLCLEQPSCDDFGPNGCGGLPAPPTEVLNSGQDLKPIFARYLNQTCCYTERIPKEVTIVGGDNPARIGRKLPLVVFYGAEQKYNVCESCGEEPIFYAWGTENIIAEKDLPICTEPCGFQFPALTKPTCTFFLVDGCDQNATPVKAVKIQFVDCGDGKVINAIYEIDATGALIDYQPIEVDGEVDIDDCNGGIIVSPVPVVDCYDYSQLEREICIISDGIECAAYQTINYCDNIATDTTVSTIEGVTTEYTQIDCNKCYQIAGCLDFRLAVASIVTLGDGTTIPVSGSGKQQDVIDAVVAQCGGTGYYALGLNQGGQSYTCDNVNLGEFVFTGLSCDLESFTTQFGIYNFTDYGNCGYPITIAQENCTKSERAFCALIDGVNKTIYRIVETCNTTENITYEDALGNPVKGTEFKECNCADYLVQDLFELQEVTGDLIVRNWDISTIIPNDFPNEAAASQILDNFDFTQTPTSGPVSSADLTLNDTNNSGQVQDVEVKKGYIIVDAPISLRFYANSEGVLRVRLGDCCSELIELYTYAKSVGLESTPTIDLQKGIHRIELINLDYGASNSKWTTQYSYDNINYTNDNTPPGIRYSSTKPNEICKKVQKCTTTGAFTDFLTNNPVDIANCYTKSLLCTPAPVVAQNEGCVQICADPCDGVDLKSTKTQSEYDCRVSNIEYDSTFNWMCIDGVKLPKDTIVVENTISEGCQDIPDMKLSADLDDGDLQIVGWNGPQNQPNCPLYGSFTFCFKADLSAPNTLTMVSLSKDPNETTWVSEFVWYLQNRTAPRAAYYEITGGYVDGWENLTANSVVEICMDRDIVAATMTYTRDGVVDFVSNLTTAGELGPLYFDNSFYAANSGFWVDNGAAHVIYDIVYCEKESASKVINSSRMLNISVDNIPVDDIANSPWFWQYAATGIIEEELKEEMSFFNLSQKDLDNLIVSITADASIGETSEELSEKIFFHLKRPYAVSTIYREFKLKQLRTFSIDRNIITEDQKIRKTDLIIRMLAWAQKNRIITKAQYEEEVLRVAQ